MFKKLFGRSQNSDDLATACRSEDRDKFAELFGRAQIFFICLSPEMEHGIEPSISKEDFLEKVRTAAKDFSKQEQFVPFCYTRGSQKRMPLFTDQGFVRVRPGVCQGDETRETHHVISSLGYGRSNLRARTRKRRCSRPQ